MPDIQDATDVPRPRFLVTAGNTRERIDRVRDWGNIFTGNTGLAIAQALALLGHVHLLTSNTAHLDLLSLSRSPIRTARFTSHADLRAALHQAMSVDRYDAVFMTAAVADYRPACTYEILRGDAGLNRAEEIWTVRDCQRGKVKSTHDAIAVLGQRTEKLVDLFRTAWNHRGMLVKFKLEVDVPPDDLLAIARHSRTSSGANYLVANTLDMVEGDRAGAYLVGPDSSEWVPRPTLATRLARLTQDFIATRDLARYATAGYG